MGYQKPGMGRNEELGAIVLQAILDADLTDRVEFLTFDCIRKPTNLHAIEVSPMPSKELWTDVAIVMIGFVPALTAVCVIFFFF